MKQSHKTLLLWVLLIGMFLLIWQFLSPERSPAQQVAFSDFISRVQADDKDGTHVDSVKVKDRELVDGGIVSTTNLDIAIEAGAKLVVVVNPLVAAYRTKD